MSLEAKGDLFIKAGSDVHQPAPLTAALSANGTNERLIIPVRDNAFTADIWAVHATI